MIDEMPREQWLAYDCAHPAPTFFARPAWSLALEEAMPSLAAAPLRVHADGHRFLLPAMRSIHRRTPFREYLAFPLGGYTCLLDETGRVASVVDVETVLERLHAEVDHIRLFPWPLAPFPAHAPFLAQVYETAVIDCCGGFDAVLAGVRGVTRRMAGQAQRRGVTCERAPAREVGVYYAMLREVSARWPAGRPSISQALLERVLFHGGDDAQLWFAYANGRPVAGGVVLFGSDELFFWSAAMDRAAATLRPSNALNLTLLQAACKRGLRWYNLGASEGLGGVARFKHDLGARPVTYAEVRLRRPSYALYERVRSLIARTAEPNRVC